VHQLLIVDDNLGVRETFGAALRRERYAVLDADTGGRAIESLAAHSPSALFLDLRLPDMTEFDVLRWMRSAERFVPTAVVTAFRVEFDPDEAIALGALAYADQPLSSDTLLRTARALVRPPSAHDDPDDLHRRVLAGDPAALDALAEICLRELPRRLERAFPREPWDLAVDAVIEYADFECGACRQFVKDVEPSLMRDYVDRGHVKFVFKNFPLVMHVRGSVAAAAASCAALQGRFWPMHNWLFAAPPNLDDSNLQQPSTGLGLDIAKYNACRMADQAAYQIQAARSEGDALNVAATPTFFFGKILADKHRVQSSDTMIGYRSLEAFKSTLDRLLR
jgi:CheY-like chemotaxis protein